MSKLRFAAPMLLLLSAAAAASGCGGDDPVTAVQHQITCHDVCKRYADCFATDYDVDACTSRCTDKVEGDAEKDGKLRTCNACMDDKSCLSSVFNCTVECSSFVP